MTINIPCWTTSKEEADKLVDELSEGCYEYGKDESKEKMLDVFYKTKMLKNYVGIMQGRIELLTARIAELEMEVTKGHELQDELTARIAELYPAVGLMTTLKPTMVMDAEHPLEMAIEVVEHVTARIAELEAEVTELKPYRDGYDPEEVFPPEGEWVWLRDCDDDIEPVQYDHKAEIYWNYGMNADGVEFTYWERNNGDLRRWYPISPLPTLPEVQE